MPSYAPAKPKTCDRPKRPRALNPEHEIRRTNMLGSINALRETLQFDEQLLGQAQATLDELRFHNANEVWRRAFTHAEGLILRAIGARPDPKAPIEAPRYIDPDNPPVGLRFLIGLDAFLIHEVLPSEYKPGGTGVIPERITGYWAHDPDKQVTLQRPRYQAGLIECAARYGWELDSYLERFHARNNHITTRSTFEPRRSDRSKGPARYKVHSFVDLNRMRVLAYPADAHNRSHPDLQTITVAQWNYWTGKSRSKGKNG